MTLENHLTVSYRGKQTFTLHPEISYLGISSSELKIYVHTKPCTQMLMAALP